MLQLDEACEWRKGTDGLVPATNVATGQIHNDVERDVEKTQLMDPGFVAVEDEKAGHRARGSNPETRNQWRVNGELRSTGAAERSSPKGNGFKLAAAGFEAGAPREEHHADVFQDIAQFGDLAEIQVKLAVNLRL